MEARNEEKKSYLTTEYAGLSWRGFGYVCRSTTPMKSVISETNKIKSSYHILLCVFLSDADSPLPQTLSEEPDTFYCDEINM